MSLPIVHPERGRTFNGGSSMGVIEALRQNKKVMIGGAIGFLVLASFSMAYQLWPRKHYSQTLAYFSDDDGKSWFLDDADNVPPFDHDGKQAVRATIYSYDNGSKKFCGCLMQFGPKAHKAIEAAIAKGATADPPLSPQAIMFGQDFAGAQEIKKPDSDERWRSPSDPKAIDALRVQSPDGSPIDLVVP
jgi:hypothetical protein